jgi:CubicO group peptidase (beta-lactamase class C family)
MTAMGCGTKDTVKDAAKDTTKDTVKTAAAPTQEQKLAEIKTKLDKEFTDFYGEGVFSGYVYISKGGTVLLDKGYGKADFEKGIENTKQTKFDIASLTKQITAFAIMQLEEKKLLTVNDTIDKYLPSFPHGQEITIHQLLTHTSGMPEHSIDFDIRKFKPSYKGFGKEGKNENVKLLFTPGSSFKYSNAGYILLGYIIEKLSGKTLGDYFKENIFNPLSMNNTAFRDKNGEAKDLAVGYANEKKEKVEKPWNLTNIGYELGSAVLCSTEEDLLKWAQALNEQKLISKESYEKMYTPNKSNYGYGVYVYKDSKGNRSYEHYGFASGYRSYLLRGVDEGIVAIIVSNNQNIPIDSMAGQLKRYIQ